MNAEEITAGLAEAQNLPKGRLKAERLELLAAAAKALGDPGLEANVLLGLSRAYEYGGERERLPVVFGRLLKLLDEHPVEVGGHSHSIHWMLKWMTYGLVRNPDVPLATASRWLDEFEARYRQRGHSPRPVHALRAEFALAQYQTAAASAAMEAAIAAPRDRMADCDACERNDWGSWRSELGDYEGAIEYWGPVISGERRCAEEPHRVLALALLPLVRLGRLDEARSAYLKGYPLVQRNVSMRRAIGHHLEFCALTGNEARGLEILAEHVGWLSDQQEDVSHRFQFGVGVVVLLRRLVALGHGEIPVGADTAAGVLAAMEKEVTEIAGRYDRRNGNSTFGERLVARLAQEPLVDWLPLGVNASLPRAAAAVATVSSATAEGRGASASATAAAAAAEPWGEIRPLAIRATEALRDDDAEAAERLVREALRRGGPLIPQGAAAQLYSTLAEALRRQPDREIDLIDAALKASARWDGLSEPDTLHERFTAAQVYHHLGRHAEAVALFEDAIERVEVPYDPPAVAQTRWNYGTSLRRLGRHREAAEQLMRAAALLQDDPSNQGPHAQLASQAAEALQASGRRAEALVAFERAAALWEELAVFVPSVRCRRSIAWLVAEHEPERAVELMRAVLAGIRDPDPKFFPGPPESLVGEIAEDVAEELAETERQLERLVQNAARRAKAADRGEEHDEDDVDDED